MKLFLFLFLFAVKSPVAENPDLSELRKLYQSAATERSSSRRMESVLSGVDNNSNPVLVCYKGVSEMLEAKYSWNPYVKYKKFNTGRALMEKAIGREPDNIEMRLLRYSIQSSLPSFLNYHANIAADKVFLKNAVVSVQDKTVRDMLIRAIAE